MGQEGNALQAFLELGMERYPVKPCILESKRFPARN
ncbi:hypothetical protein NITGR_740026 [Nitrospina gracilis 3/211]|uniref:Uncharacterized protein n=1 Tax=Nitrospina gracilis (strain 3/211) TaxID=1266370 RepID=M1Z0Y3_NITG3|nr:hypothetical protein NITGR_740026 [Nitrospina gracilis 3/211]